MKVQTRRERERERERESPIRCIANGEHLKYGIVCTLQSVNVTEKEKRHQMKKELEALVEIGHVSPELVSFYGGYFQEGNVVFAIEYMNRGSLQV